MLKNGINKGKRGEKSVEYIHTNLKLKEKNRTGPVMSQAQSQVPHPDHFCLLRREVNH